MAFRSLSDLALSTVMRREYGTAITAFPFSIGLLALMPTIPLGGDPKYEGKRILGSAITPLSFSHALNFE